MIIAKGFRDRQSSAQPVAVRALRYDPRPGGRVAKSGPLMVR
ncbi:MAG: hypothetical protein ACFB0E_23190 [Leptolyngbyaceae cyanobacterium]